MTALFSQKIEYIQGLEPAFGRKSHPGSAKPLSLFQSLANGACSSYLTSFHSELRIRSTNCFSKPSYSRVPPPLVAVGDPLRTCFCLPFYGADSSGLVWRAAAMGHIGLPGDSGPAPSWNQGWADWTSCSISSSWVISYSLAPRGTRYNAAYSLVLQSGSAWWLVSFNMDRVAASCQLNP